MFLGFQVHLAHAVHKFTFNIYEDKFMLWNISVEEFPRDINNCHTFSFVWINEEAGEKLLHTNGWWGCMFFSYEVYLGSSIFTCPPFYFTAWFLFYYVNCPQWSFILWYCESVGIQFPYYLHVFQFFVLIIHGWHHSLYLHDSWWSSWMSFLWMSHPRLVCACHA